jgi:hypothetical protein
LEAKLKTGVKSAATVEAAALEASKKKEKGARKPRKIKIVSKIAVLTYSSLALITFLDRPLLSLLTLLIILTLLILLTLLTN